MLSPTKYQYLFLYYYYQDQITSLIIKIYILRSKGPLMIKKRNGNYRLLLKGEKTYKTYVK